MVLAVLDSRNLLFSEAAQSIYELDAFSAYVWRSLDLGLSPEQIAREIIAGGGEPEAAQSAVAAAVQSLRAIENSKSVPAAIPGSPPIACLTRMTLALAGVAVQLNLPEALFDDVDAALGHLRSDSHQSHAQLSACLNDYNVQVGIPGKPFSSCRRSEFVPLIKTLLIDTVLRCANYEVALHAAALVRESNVLLLLGSPGAGKTTLATALVRRDFQIASDDVVLLHDSGSVTGLLLPFTIKEGAWSLLSSDWPQLMSQPVYYRPDGVAVRYLQHESGVDCAPRRIQNVILLDRQVGTSASLQEVGAVSALQALIAEGDAQDERLSEAAFRSLVDGLRDARCFRLTYSDLSDAAETVSSLYL